MCVKSCYRTPVKVYYYLYVVYVHRLGCTDICVVNKSEVTSGCHKGKCYEMDTIRVRRLQYDPVLGITVTSGTTTTNIE